MEFILVVNLFFLLWVCNGFVFGSSTQSSIEAAKKETGIICIQSDINGLKDDMHELLKRVSKNENEIEFLKSENQYLTNELTNKRRQFSCEINELHENTYENQKAVQYTNTEINHLNETIKELRNGVDRLEELERRRSEENITECIEKSDTTGNEFYLGFLESYNQDGKLHLFLVSTTEGTCKIFIPALSINTSFAVSNTSINSYEISPTVSMNQLGIQRKAIHVKCDIPVSMYGLTFTGSEVDGFLALPSKSLGNKYIISSFTPWTKYIPHSNSNFGIIGIDKSTNVTIYFRIAGGSVTYNNIHYKNNDTLNIHLTQFDTFYLSSHYDFSGTLVAASKPVAVMSGVRTSYLRNGWGNHMGEMILPNEHLGRDFIVPKLYDSQCNFRIFAPEHSRVRIYNNSLIQYTDIQRGRFLEFENYDTLYTLQSSAPIQVQLYCNGVSSTADAFMVTLPSVQHFKSSYKFPVVNDFQNSNPHQHFYNTVIVQSNARMGLRLDDKDMVKYEMITNITLGSTMYSVITVEQTIGLHEIKQNNDIPFGLIVFGRNKYSGYGFPAGFATNINP